MSERKNLLKENTIRRFMKLAGTQAITSDFLKEDFAYARDDEAEEELDLGAEVAEPAVEDLPPEPEGGVDLEADEGEEEDAEEGSVEAFARDALEAFKDVAAEHGVEVEVEELEEPEELEVGELEVPEEEGEELEGLGAGEELGELGAEEGEEEALELAEINYIDPDALMETVYKRVASRLVKDKRADDMANILAEKISRRLNKKSPKRRR